MDLTTLTIKEASRKLRSREITSVELTRACLKNIEEKNEELNIFLEVFEDALDQARKADDMIQKGLGNELTGMPLAIKDNILITGRKCSAASKMLENYTASYDAFVIKKLKAIGAVLIGRTNMDEFAMGGSTENSAFGPTRNPHNNNYVPGGSSGGSAAAVISNMALGALGSDTGGSIRQPASFCGLVGMKPSYGAVSRSGLIAMASSLDQIGPFAKTLEDAKIIFDTISGKDEMDSTSFDITHPITPSPLSFGKGGRGGEVGIKGSEVENIFSSPSPLSFGEGGRGGEVGDHSDDVNNHKKRIGVPRDWIKKGIDKDVLENFTNALERLKNNGYEIIDISLPYTYYSLAAYYIIMPAEVSTNLSRFDGARYGLSNRGENFFDDFKKSRSGGFGAEVRRRIILGTYVLSHGYYDAYYAQAWKVRRAIENEFKDVFQKVDFVAMPTAPSPAFKFGAKSEPLQMYLEDIFTVPANIAGIPAVSIPIGFSKESLPIGMQFYAPFLRDQSLFTIKF